MRGVLPPGGERRSVRIEWLWAEHLTKDADYAYVYDAWNNLVSAKAQNDTDVVVATYKFFADDRRASKVVTNRGQLNGTTYYFYDNHEVIEERNSSEALVQQYVYGPNHIDELLMVRGLTGPLFTYQDPNWNVIAATSTRYAMADA